MNNERFIDVSAVKSAISAENWDKVSDICGDRMHCKICGDTSPKHGFYPLGAYVLSSDIVETSMWECNRCARSDEDYLKTFGEPKEVLT